MPSRNETESSNKQVTIYYLIIDSIILIILLFKNIRVIERFTQACLLKTRQKVQINKFRLSNFTDPYKLPG